MNKELLIRSHLSALPGKVGFYYKDLTSGEVITYNEKESFLAASIIKLPIFAHIMEQAHLGNVDLKEKIKITHEEYLPSCGALNLFEEEPVVTLKTLCNMMIALSDNTATNVLIRKFGIEPLNEGFRRAGFEKTHIERPLFDKKGAAAGKANYFVPEEVGLFLEKLYKGEFVTGDVSDEIIKTLKMQNINHKIPGLMEERFEVAHKTGEDTGITHDVGIVYCEQPFIIVFASNNTDVGVMENLMRNISLEFTKKTEI